MSLRLGSIADGTILKIPSNVLAYGRQVTGAVIASRIATNCKNRDRLLAPNRLAAVQRLVRRNTKHLPSNISSRPTTYAHAIDRSSIRPLLNAAASIRYSTPAPAGYSTSRRNVIPSLFITAIDNVFGTSVPAQIADANPVPKA